MIFLSYIQHFFLVLHTGATPDVNVSINSLVESIISTGSGSPSLKPVSSSSPIIETPPYCNPVIGGSKETSQLGTDSPLSFPTNVIPRIIVKVSCRKSKEERNFILNDVEEENIATLKDLKFYCLRNLPVSEVVNVGYILKGRMKVSLKTDEELKNLIVTTLQKGKGSLWCEGIVLSHVNSDILSTTTSDSSAEQSEIDLCDQRGEASTKSCDKRGKHSKRRKTIVDEKRERVQELFEELKLLHGTNFSGPQYRLWAEAIAANGHFSKDEPPKGSIFKHTVRGPIKCQASASLEISPTKCSMIEPQKSNCLTPKSAASLKSTYIKQIKELHELLELKAIPEEDFVRQRDHILEKMSTL